MPKVFQSDSLPVIAIAGYFDVLGFSELIRLSENDWPAAIRKVKTIDATLRENFIPPRDDGVVRFFSDNVYVSVPLRAGASVWPDNLFWFFMQLSNLQWFFVQAGIFLRGGIAVGTQYFT